MKITFDNVMEKVVKSRYLSRRDKQNEIKRFIKEYSGSNKPTSDKELETLEELKSIKKVYAMQDAEEKIKDKSQ
ncbi:hypothetical protein RCC89_12075 [Cytophagaceae bacterium ABcell3]|nr:hypothetical protein RCC89_12075 [Cytophagaceae bacterium ABcell3]